MSKITDKQKAARIANLEKGRQKRLEKLQQKKESKEQYSASEDDTSSSDSDEGYVISKKKPTKIVKTKGRVIDESSFMGSKNELDELKKIMMEMAIKQKQHDKALRRQNKRSKSPAVVVVPQYGEGHNVPKASNNPVYNALRDKIMQK